MERVERVGREVESVWRVCGESVESVESVGGEEEMRVEGDSGKRLEFSGFLKTDVVCDTHWLGLFVPPRTYAWMGVVVETNVKSREQRR